MLFRSIDITPSYNMLLGRPWIHSLNAVSSTLHQKVRIPYEGRIATIEASNLRAVIQHRRVDKNSAEIRIEAEEDLSGFDFELNMIEHDPNFAVFANDIVRNMVIKQGYEWGQPLTKRGDIQKRRFKGPNNRFGVTMGLGFKPNAEDISILIQQKELRKNTRAIKLQPYSLNLADYFVGEKEIMTQRIAHLDVKDCFVHDKTSDKIGRAHV